MRNCYPDKTTQEKCVETPESEKKKDPVVESTDEARKLEEVVVTAQKERKDLQGGVISWGGEDEFGFEVKFAGLVPITTTPAGTKKCRDGKSELEMFKTSAPAGSTRSRTHPDSYGSPGRVPGDGDNVAALRANSKVAFMMTSTAVFMIEAMANGTYRAQVSSGEITSSQRAQLIRTMRRWENPKKGGSC
jgi:hypothetical protein